MMHQKEEEVFKYLMTMYSDYWMMNNYNRDNYNEDLEYYIGYRNAQEYPLAYSEVFNKILPIIYTILSRFMDQLYQSGNIVSVKPRKKKDIRNAKSVESVLNYQLESLNDIDMQGGSYLTMMKWFFNALTFGKGIVKAYWRKEDRITPRRIALPKPKFDRFGRLQGMDYIDHVSQEMQTIYDGPYVEVLHNKLFLPHPEYRSIQKMPACFLVYKKSIDYIRQKHKQGIYHNLDELGWTSAGGAGTESRDSREAFVKSLSIEGADTITSDELNNDLKTPEVDIIEAYTRLILKDAPYEVGSGLQIKGDEEECIAHIGNYKTILSVQRNIYGTRPMFDIGCYLHPEMYWDLGMVRLTKGIQEQYNNLGNLRMQNAMMLINQMIKVRADADIDPQALVWRPFGIVPVDDMDDVQPLTVPDFNSQIFKEQESFYDSTIQDLTGMYEWNMGRTPERQEKVGVVQGIAKMGEARAKLMLMSMDYLGIRPLLKYMMILNTYHLPSGFEYRLGDREGQSFGQIFSGDIHPDFDFSARYTAMEPVLGKQYRAQQLVQLAAAWQKNPWINWYQMSRVIMELLDIRESDQVLKHPQQFAQEMQMKQKQAMMAEQAKMGMETQSKIAIENARKQASMKEKMAVNVTKAKTDTESRSMLSDQDFREDMSLRDQDFIYDMALQAIQNEATKGKE